MNLEDPDYWKSLINMSLTRFFILQTLNKGSAHGYVLLEKLERFTEGCCTPAYSTIYPILKEFVEGGYASVRSDTEAGRARKVYTLTAKGRRAHKKAVQAWREVIPYVEKVVTENP